MILRPDGNITQTSFTGGYAEIDETVLRPKAEAEAMREAVAPATEPAHVMMRDAVAPATWAKVLALAESAAVARAAREADEEDDEDVLMMVRM